MPANPTLEAWKHFLNGRILQEQGNDKEALEAFDRAMSLQPANEHFQRARAIALANLGRAPRTLPTLIEQQYEELARRYIGANDRTEAWIDGLQRLVQDTDAALSGRTVTGFVVW